MASETKTKWKYGHSPRRIGKTATIPTKQANRPQSIAVNLRVCFDSPHALPPSVTSSLVPPRFSFSVFVFFKRARFAAAAAAASCGSGHVRSGPVLRDVGVHGFVLSGASACVDSCRAPSLRHPPPANVCILPCLHASAGTMHSLSLSVM